jgi:hypothetical protein
MSNSRFFETIRVLVFGYTLKNKKKKKKKTQGYRLSVEKMCLSSIYYSKIECYDS